MDLDRILAQIERGPRRSFSREELKDRLARAHAEKRQLRVKLGIDPTASDIHLGFAVVLRMLRRFQDLGHKAVLIIGDYTAQVGDPSGKSAMRPILSQVEVEKNATTYITQVKQILDPSPERLEITTNGAWFSRMTFIDVIRLAGKSTVQRLLERNDFTARMKAQEPLYLHG